ncbi:MAG TPA: bacteriocin fulvocin C-related protein [Vicinamibacterales bacterium]|jgi:hypothetical protein
MTPRTRRRLTICAVLSVLILPAEIVLLPVARTPDQLEAAMAWTDGLSAGELQQASFQIDAYPAAYRRAILSALGPEDRSAVWRVHFLKYRSTHPELTPAQAAVIEEAIEIATSDAFMPPIRPALREQIQRTFNRAVSILGPKAAEELFVSLGPKDAPLHNALPLTQRIADRVRSWRVVSAATPDCNCNVDIDTCDIGPDPWLSCSEQYSCNFDLDWPMCGPLWAWACTGWCKVMRWPLDEALEIDR